MTEPEPTNVPEPTDSGPTPTDTTSGQAPGENSPPESEPSPNSEAARWRTKFREAEAQIAAQAEEIRGHRRKDCERAIQDLLEEPADLWDIGLADLSAFYDDDGTLNEGELRAAAGALIDQRPKLAQPRGPRWQDFGQGRQPPPQRGIGWNAVLKQ